MTDEAFSYNKGHRDRQRDEFLQNPSGTPDYKLLEILLYNSFPRIDTKPIAKDLIRNFSGLHQVTAAPFEDLLRMRGIGRNTAVFFKALHEFNSRYWVFQLKNNPIFHDPSLFVNYALNHFSNKKDEEFRVLYMDRDYRLIYEDVHSTGTVDWAAVYPRKILHQAMNLNASVVAMLHNHPNGNPNFSEDDIKATDETKLLLNRIGIGFYDHFLVAGGVVYSAKNLHLIN